MFYCLADYVCIYCNSSLPDSSLHDSSPRDSSVHDSSVHDSSLCKRTFYNSCLVISVSLEPCFVASDNIMFVSLFNRESPRDVRGAKGTAPKHSLVVKGQCHKNCVCSRPANGNVPPTPPQDKNLKLL
jgi:hypothetical protein